MFCERWPPGIRVRASNGCQERDREHLEAWDSASPSFHILHHSSLRFLHHLSLRILHRPHLPRMPSAIPRQHLGPQAPLVRARPRAAVRCNLGT